MLNWINLIIKLNRFIPYHQCDFRKHNSTIEKGNSMYSIALILIKSIILVSYSSLDKSFHNRFIAYYSKIKGIDFSICVTKIFLVYQKISLEFLKVLFTDTSHSGPSSVTFNIYSYLCRWFLIKIEMNLNIERKTDTTKQTLPNQFK